MTLSECVAKITQFKPSEYDKDDITGWINQVEFLVYDQVIGRSEQLHPPEEGDPVVVLPSVDNYTPDNAPQEEQEPYKCLTYAEDAERQLLLPDQFTDAYIYYVSSKIDLQNMEVDRYNVNAMAFEEQFQNYAKWYRRTHKPKEVRHDVHTGFIGRSNTFVAPF